MGSSDTRERWVHEDDLINQRLGWLLNSQSLLFAGYGISLRETTTPQMKLFQEVIPVLGLVVCCVILLGLTAARLAQKTIRKASAEDRPDVTSTASFLGFICSVGLPVTFITAWWFLV